MRLNNKTRDAILMAALNKSGIFQKKDAIRQRYAAWAGEPCFSTSGQT